MSGKLTGGQVVDLMDRIKTEAPLIDGSGLLRSTLEWFGQVTRSDDGPVLVGVDFGEASGDRTIWSDPPQVPRQTADMTFEQARAIYTPGERQAYPVEEEGEAEDRVSVREELFHRVTADVPIIPPATLEGKTGQREQATIINETHDPSPDQRPDWLKPAEVTAATTADAVQKIPYAGKDREHSESVKQSWTPDRDARLIGYWNDGLSRSDIAERMQTSMCGIDQRIYRLQKDGRIAKRAPSKVGLLPSDAAPAANGPAHPEKLTEAEMQANIDALKPLDDGWRTQDDIKIIEGVVAGDGAGQIAEALACSKQLVLGRLREIAPKASPHNYQMALKCLLRRAFRETDRKA